MLKTRIQILFEGNVISEKVALYVNEVIDMMNREFENPDQTKAEMFITHIAMATQRICDNNCAEGLDEELWKDVQNSENFEKAIIFYEEIKKKSPVIFPEEEKKFLLLHLCNLFD